MSEQYRWTCSTCGMSYGIKNTADVWSFTCSVSKAHSKLSPNCGGTLESISISSLWEQVAKEFEAEREQHSTDRVNQRKALTAAKLREAEQASALEIARTALQQAIDHMVKNGYGSPSFRDYLRQSITIVPSAALAERDRAIEQRTAERCKILCGEVISTYFAAEAIAREFGLEPKTEGK